MQKGRYSKYIRPILYSIDVLIAYTLTYFFLSQELVDILFIVASWITLSIILSFYEVYRFTKIITIISLLLRQAIILILLIMSYFYLRDTKIPPRDILNFFLILCVTLTIWRIFLHVLFKKYRLITGSNYKKVVIIGNDDSTKKLAYFFNNAPEYGYRYLGFFTDEDSEERLGNIESAFDYILDNDMDEIYCSIKELTNNQIKSFIEFSDVNVKALKFIPDNKGLFAKNLHLNYYDLTPILSLRKIPLEDSLNNLLKRGFDIVFSLIIIFFVLSWLIPILGIIIRIDSKGPIFFRQNRPGIKERGFGCYKFRSMTINERSEDSAVRNDPRVTKVGKFIRKTSIDELPQFFNVLFGSMSVVGPRPHLWRQNEMYGKKISKYMVRYFVKPGITGLAQVRGYRGEIETKKDIVNRTKYDIFYIENWSLLMDFNIIIQTVLNAISGEDKAY